MAPEIGKATLTYDVAIETSEVEFDNASAGLRTRGTGGVRGREDTVTMCEMSRRIVGGRSRILRSVLMRLGLPVWTGLWYCWSATRGSLGICGWRYLPR